MVIFHPTWICLCVCVASSQPAVSDLYSQIPGGFLPSPVKYFKPNGDQIAMESETISSNFSQDNSVAATNNERSQQPRLGYPLYSGTSLNAGYPATSPAVYSPVKLDLGGLLLGTVIGLGAVLLIPKIIHIFSYSGPSYGHYGRNGEDVTAGLTDMISRVDEALAEQHINTTACLQRALCSSVQSSSEPSTLNSFVSATTRNPLISFLMQGSRLQLAVEAGLSGHNCAAAYPQCPFNQDSITAGLKAITSSLQT